MVILLTCISKRLYPSYVSQEYWRRSLEWLSCTCFYHRWLDRTFSSLGRGTGNRSRLFHTRLVLSDKCFSTQSDQNHCCLYLQIQTIITKVHYFKKVDNRENQFISSLMLDLWLDFYKLVHSNHTADLIQTLNEFGPLVYKQFTILGHFSVLKITSFVPKL